MPIDNNAQFVVSIASYPKRDPLLPAVFQALSRQTVVLAKWILVLSVEDYPNGLPRHLKKLEKRGVEILWVEDNPYAVKKLIPVILKYPDLGIVTLNDDINYQSLLLSDLVSKVKEQECIAGYVGKAMVQKENKLNMYCREPLVANYSTEPGQVYLIGWGGIYYPPGSLDKQVLNMDAVQKIVLSRGSDIWFWSAAVAKGTKQVCLGSKADLSLYFAVPEKDTTKPLDQPGTEMMEKRFQMAVDCFGIREKLLEVLPEKER